MRLDAVLAASDDGGRWVRCPFDGREVFGEARPPVAGTVNGAAFRGRLAVYGGATYLGFPREVRTAAGIDTAHRAFTALPPGHRREWTSWAAEAKRPETRLRRAASTVERLRAGARGR
jgi:hypothetical protein